MKRNYEIRIGGPVATGCHVGDSEYRGRTTRVYGSKAAANRHANSLCFAWGSAKVVDVRVHDIDKIDLGEYYDIEKEEYCIINEATS